MQNQKKKFDIKLLRYKDQAENFIERFKSFDNFSFEIIDDIKTLVKSVDVLFSCVTCADKFIIEDEKDFPKGITLVPIHTKGFQNCDTTFDRIFGDDTNHIKGFKYFSQFKGYNEIGEVLAGRDSGRINDSQRIISYNYGLGLHDVYFASKIYEMSGTKNIPTIQMTKETGKFWV